MVFNGVWQKVVKQKIVVGTHRDEADSDVLQDGNLQYTREIGGNGSKPSYQEACGAPVEKESPLGYEISWFTVIFLNIGQMIGTGVFSTRMIVTPTNMRVLANIS